MPIGTEPWGDPQMFLLPNPAWLHAAPRLLICSADAEALAGCLASDVSVTRHQRWTRLAGCSPSICLWGTLAAHAFDATELRDLPSLATWLDNHTDALLASRLEVADSRNTLRAPWQFWTQTAIHRAQSAVMLADATSSHAIDQAVFEGLVSFYSAWKDTFGLDSQDVSAPAWLEHLSSPVACAPDAASASSDRSSTDATERWQRVTTLPGMVLIDVIAQLALGRCDRIHEGVRLETAKRAAMREFAYGAGHELNNPLAIISARAQSLRAGEADPDRNRILSAIQWQADRAHDMIADMMLFAKSPRAKPERVCLDEIVRQVIAEHRTRAPQHAIELFLHEAQTLHLHADPTQMAVLIDAGIRNAIESQPDKGGVEISLDVLRPPQAPLDRSDWCRITIRDRGPGLDERARSHLFDPYFSGREAGRGHGFGLCKAWQIVENHGGVLRMEQPVDGGSQLVIELPLRTPEVDRA